MQTHSGVWTKIKQKFNSSNSWLETATLKSCKRYKKDLCFLEPPWCPTLSENLLFEMKKDPWKTSTAQYPDTKLLFHEKVNFPLLDSKIYTITHPTLCAIPDTTCFDSVNTCGICCPPIGMELGGVADTAVVGGNRGLICIPPRAIGAVIIFEDRGTTDKSNRKTRNAVQWQDEKHMQPPGIRGRGSMKGRLVSCSLMVSLRL